jgi:hypothetical protein
MGLLRPNSPRNGLMRGRFFGGSELAFLQFTFLFFRKQLRPMHSSKGERWRAEICQRRLHIYFYFVTPCSPPLRIGGPKVGFFGKDERALRGAVRRGNLHNITDMPGLTFKPAMSHRRARTESERFGSLGQRACFEALQLEPLSIDLSCFRPSSPAGFFRADFPQKPHVPAKSPSCSLQPWPTPQDIEYAVRASGKVSRPFPVASMREKMLEMLPGGGKGQLQERWSGPVRVNDRKWGHRDFIIKRGLGRLPDFGL